MKERTHRKYAVQLRSTYIHRGLVILEKRSIFACVIFCARNAGGDGRRLPLREYHTCAQRFGPAQTHYIRTEDHHGAGVSPSIHSYCPQKCPTGGACARLATYALLLLCRDDIVERRLPRWLWFIKVKRSGVIFRREPVACPGMRIRADFTR